MTHPASFGSEYPPLHSPAQEGVNAPHAWEPGRERTVEADVKPAGGALPTVSVVVLNYNGLKHLEPCFTSLEALDYPRDLLELVFVDNGSADGSVPFMRERFPSVRVVETGENLGFAAGNNYGAERATGQYVAFLNNDTRVEPDWLSEMVAALLRGRDDGVVCTSSLMLDWSGTRIDFKAGGVNFHGFGFQPSYGKPYKPGEIAPRDLLFACGGSMLIDRAIFLDVGGFDPDYFAFFEDVDLGWRLWVLGYRVTLTPRAITYHRHHGTAGSMQEHRTYVLYERNALYTIYKNYEEEHVHRILNAALLLLGERAVRFIRAGGSDLEDFEWNNPPSGDEAEILAHRNAVAGLLAVNEFMDNLQKFRAKREWLQARRVRGDRELFALFGQPGRANWINHEADARYAFAHYALLDEFGIAELWAELPKEVLVISPDVLPVGSIPASGSGVRAWALGQGLAGLGHNVHFTMPAPALKGREGSVPQEYVEGAWTPQNLQSIIDSLVPDVVVSCGWPNLTWTPRPNVPVAVDLTGPHLLERAYQGHQDAGTNAAEKLSALMRGDYFTCIGERQRYYFMAWLAQAGVPVEELDDALALIPYSVDPDAPEHKWPSRWDEVDVQFVYGGIFLPWQNAAPALLTVAEALDQAGRGRLQVVGGKHPFYPVHTGEYGPLLERLARSNRVSMSGLRPFHELTHLYTHAHVAVDVMLPNAERELAFPSRTVNYLWCGLPVIHPEYSEVACHIREYEAGWVVPHNDPASLRQVVKEILADPLEAQRRGMNAQRLARERFSWDRTIEPLARFVERPRIRRERAAPAFTSPERAATTAPASLPQRSAPVSRPEGYLVTDTWDRELPERLARVYSRRRGLAAQVRERGRRLLGAITPGAGYGSSGKAESSRRYALPELVQGHSHGQRFLCPTNGLSGIVVRPATFNRRNTCRLVLHLRSNPGAGSDFYSVNLPAHKVSDDEALAFRFPPIPDSAGRWFYFVADCPDGVPGDAASLYATNQHLDFNARRYEDGLPAEGSLIMTLEFNGAAS